MDLETVSLDTVTVRPIGGEPLSGIYTYQFNQLSFSPDEPFAADTSYQLSIPAGGLTDAMGNGLDDDFLAHFSTGTSVTLPVPDPPPPPMGTGGATAGGGGTGGEAPFVRFMAPPATGGAGSGGTSTGGAGAGGVPAGAGGAGPVTGGVGSLGPDMPGSGSSCSMSHGDSSGARIFSLAMLGALLAFGRRNRRWV